MNRRSLRCPRLQITGLLDHMLPKQDQKRPGQAGGRTRPLAAGDPDSTVSGIQRGPAQLGPEKSGTRVWPGGGTQAAGRGPRWPRRRGGQPEPTGTEPTSGCRRATSPDTVHREEGLGRRTLDPKTPALGGLWHSPLPEATHKGRSTHWASSYCSCCYLCLANPTHSSESGLTLTLDTFPYCVHPMGLWFFSGLGHAWGTPGGQTSDPPARG